MKWIWPDGTVTGEHDVHFCEVCVRRRSFDTIGCIECGCPEGTTREVKDGRLRITFPDGRNFTCDDDTGEEVGE